METFLVPTITHCAILQCCIHHNASLALLVEARVDFAGRTHWIPVTVLVKVEISS